MSASITAVGKPTASPSSPTLLRMQALSEVKDEYLRSQHKQFEDYIHPYIKLFEEFTAEELKNHVISLRKTFKDGFSRTVDKKNVVKNFIEQHPDKASTVCALILDVAYFTETYEISVPILELIIESKIILNKKYTPLINLLNVFCRNINKKLVTETSGPNLISIAYQALSVGNTPTEKRMTDILKKADIVNHNVYSDFLHNCLQSAIQTKNIDFLMECLGLINFYNLHLNTFYTRGNIPDLVQTCVKALKDQREDLSFEILQFLCNWAETISEEDFCRYLLPVVEENPALTLEWLKKSIKSEDTTLPHNLMALLRKQNVSKSPIVKDGLIELLILSLKNENICFRDELRKGINVLNTEKKDPQVSEKEKEDDKVKAKEKSYVYIILEYYFQKLREKSHSTPLSSEDKNDLFLLLNYSLYIHNDNEFASKCIDFIREFDFAAELPLTFNLTPLEKTHIEKFVYEARAEVHERPSSKAVLKFMLLPTKGLEIENVKEFAEAYICGTRLRVINFFGICIQQLKFLKIEEGDDQYFIQIFENTPRYRQIKLLEAFVIAYFCHPESRSSLARALTSLNLSYTINASSLLQKNISEGSLNSFATCGFRIEHLNLQGCVIDAKAWPKVQQVSCHHLTLNHSIQTSAISASTKWLTLSGNVVYYLQLLENMKIQILEFENFQCNGTQNDFLELSSTSELNKTLTDLRFTFPAGPILFGDESAKVVEKLPNVTSFTFQNTEITSRTVDLLRRTRSKLDNFTLVTRRSWSEFSNSLEELIGQFSVTLRSFTFRNSETKIEPGFAYSLKGMSLTSLCLSGNLENNMVNMLATDHPDLTTLEIPHNPRIDDLCIPAIAKLSKLKVLNVARTGMTPEGIVKLANSLPNLTSITIGYPEPAKNFGLAEKLSKYEVTIESIDPNLPFRIPQNNDHTKV